MAERRASLDKPVSEALLAKLGETRRALHDAQRQLRRGCVQARAVDALVGDIDELATLMTGNRTYFHLEPHTARTHFGGNGDGG
jgi:hypothetical protein